MHSIFENKGTFSWNVVDHSHAGKKHWGLVFYGFKKDYGLL